MLDTFIIEELRRREERERRNHAEQPRLELPVDDRDRLPMKSEEDPEPGIKRGVIVIDY